MTAGAHSHAGQAAQQPGVQPAPVAGAAQCAALPTRAQGETAVAHFDAGRLDEADAAARALIEQFPAHPLGWKMRALTLYRLGQYHAAEPYLRRAHELIPDDPDVLQVYAALLEAQGRHADAERLCRRLLAVAPGHAEGTRLLGLVLMTTERVGEAEPLLLEAARMAPDSALAWNSLGSLYLRLGRIEEAAQQFLRSLEREPKGAGTWSNLLFCLTHSGSVEPEALVAAHRGFAEPFEAPFKPHWPQHANARDPQRTLRIGFVSADLRRHAVANFVEPVLVHLARDPGLRLYAYSNTACPDEVTGRLRGHFAEWRDVSDADDADFVRLVEADGIDILIDLSGHTGYNRLPALARKPAPVQASWIGYPGTTGLTAIDYFFADRFWAPSAHFEAQFTEKIVYLPAVAPFQPEREAPPLNALPALRNGYVTFGSFNRINKLRRDVVALWANLLRAVPTARLKIAALPADGNVDTQLAAWFAQEGIARDRLDFHPRTSVAAFLQLHHEVDIALDTFPFGGLTTALQSLWMGVPTLTLPGRTVPGRSGATVMGHAGLERFVATDAQDFARRGAALAADLPALAELRAGMRERCAASPMFQAEALARGVSEALRTMWQRWCAGLPAASFDVSAAADLQEIPTMTQADPKTPYLPPLGTLPSQVRSFTHDQLWGVKDRKRFLELMAEAQTLVEPGSFLGDNMFVWMRNNSWVDDSPFMQAWQSNALNPSDGTIVWRRYLLGCAGFHCVQLEGDFVECGVYQGSGIKTVIDYLGGTQFPKTFWGYDTFDYNPAPHHNFEGQSPGFYEKILERFSGYRQVRLIKGLIPDAFAQGMPEKIAYLHIDLNNAAGELAALNALFDRVVPGGIVIMDDYEWSGAYRDQKKAEDPWFDARGYRVFPLPTGQGLIFKR